jgi:hypothetical protein
MNRKISRVDVEPAKPRKWTEEETRLLIELARRKERVPAMARELIPILRLTDRRLPNRGER